MTHAQQDATWVRYSLMGIMWAFLGLFLIMPLVIIFFEAFREGIDVYWASITHPDTLHALYLTGIVVAICVPCNAIFGLLCAWALTQKTYRMSFWIEALLDLPMSIAPVIVGISFVLFLGNHSWIGKWAIAWGIPIIFSIPGIVIVTLFVTMGYVAKSVIALMRTVGNEQEQAALTLGASTLQTFFKITLPTIKWALWYGVLLSAARCVGEFGAVSVVSGHIRGLTNTLPLHIEVLYNEYQFCASYAVSTLLVCFAWVSVLLKSLLNRKVSI